MNGPDAGKITEEELNAYLDGELDAADVARVKAALADDPQLQVRLADLERVDESLRATLSEIDKMPLPEPVLDMIAAAKAESETPAETVVPFPAANERPARRMSFLPLATAASLALAVGLGLGVVLLGSGDPNGPGDIYAEMGPVAPDSALFAALEFSPSAVPVLIRPGQTATPAMTFETAAGEICREFNVTADNSSQQGIACRAGEGWDVRFTVAGAGTPQTGAYVPAASNTQAIDSALDTMGAGEPLSADEEAALIANNWR